ncbi:Magnesium transporter ALR1 [Nakaseomyces bracarensis]|uniref:Magnesium transporter ALR1 n=1 Tax=Nakaseomyces bracarensis TaxID=273131 RepID=A0ABR4NT91_9SACH
MSTSSDSESSSHSPACSVTESMVSMNTEDHNELYDHRQHITMPTRDGITASRPMHARQDLMYDDRANEDFGFMIIENMDGDCEPLGKEHHHLRKSALQNSNARPSRVAHSMSHQAPLEKTTTNNNTGSNSANNNNANNSASTSTNGGKRRGSSGAQNTDKKNVTSTPSSPPVKARRQSNTLSLTDKKAIKGQKSRANSISSAVSSNQKAKLPVVSKIMSQKSTDDDNNVKRKMTSATRASFSSDNSQASRESQETEEDVCFPMSPQLHSRVNGIDFDELQEFAEQVNEQKRLYELTLKSNVGGNGATVHSGSSSSVATSEAALKYTPRHVREDNMSKTLSNEEKQISDPESSVPPPGISFGNNKIEGDDEAYPDKPVQYTQTPENQYYGDGNFKAPDRFSFFCSDLEETVHAPDIGSLVGPDQTFKNLFRGGEPTWWLDCSCPTDDEMRCIAKAFGIHPLTAEDIRMQETREKVELFKSYYFVCFHTFENDNESEEFLEPINVYVVVFRSGVLTFHFGPISHCANVRRRVRQLRDYVDVNSDWLCYALIDDITDSFAPVIRSIEYEADAIDDSVFMARDVDFAVMLQRIGESRRKTMTLMRLLSGKADVIKMFAKRCQDEANGIGPALTSQINIANLTSSSDPNIKYIQNMQMNSQPRGDIALYLGDIQDHLLTMYQNLSAYEKIFSRSHTNYLAQLQVESFNSNNKVTEILSKVTMLGTVLVPLNLITGLFGMNVRVPGQDSSIAWWFGILAVMFCIAGGLWVLATLWIKRIQVPSTLNEASESGTRSILSSFIPRNSQADDRRAQGQRPFPGGPSNRSVASLPSRYSRYD